MNVCVVGLGYVGLPLAVACSAKHEVVGFDVKEERISELACGFDSTGEVSGDSLAGAVNLRFTNAIDDCCGCDIYIVTVPTPVTTANVPDLSPLRGAANLVGSVLNPGAVVIFESTVYPGCTEAEAVPVLERASGLRYNIDFFTGYSPERINPADKTHGVADIVKVVSGSTPEVLELVDSFYSSFITAGTHRASSISVAEAAKVIENAQRDINIAFVNELAVIFDAMGLDTQEVLDAAGTKWNFLKFKPGLVGGHCIGIDPYYLAHRAQELGHHPEMLLAGRRINEAMVDHLVKKLCKLMPKNVAPNAVRILVMGLTFKEDCPDVRNSKSIDLVEELRSLGFDVTCMDPLISQEDVPNLNLIEEEMLSGTFDCFLVTVPHIAFKEKSKEWFDLRGSDGYFVFDVKRGLDNMIGALGL